MSDAAQPSAQDTPNADQGASAENSQAQPAAEQKPAGGESKPEASATPKTEAKDAKGEAPAVPEKYELKLPENSQLSADHVEKVALYAKEQKLSNEQAQALLERENLAVSEFANRQQEEFKARTEAWLGEIKADKEIGGEAFNQNVEMAKRVVTRYATEEFRKTLDDTGLGNHPELVRVFSRIGKAMSEDQLVIPGSQAGGKKAIEDVFYGNNNQ